MSKKYLRFILPTALFFSASIFIYDQIRKLGGIEYVFDIEDDEDELQDL
jgi:hypothetical protein